MKRALIIAKREYIKVITKPTFWLSVFLPPLLVLIIGFISGYSSKVAADKIKEQATQAKTVYIQDDSKLINPQLFNGAFKVTENKETAQKEVVDGKADAFIYIPQNVLESGNIEIFQEDKGIFSNGRFGDVVQELLKASVLTQVPNQESVKVFSNPPEVTIRSYKEGKEVNNSFERFIVPIISVIVYFMLTTLGASYMLMSASEEKENRAIETILSLVKPSELFLGKLIGLVGIVLTQLFVLTGLSLGTVFAAGTQLPINLSGITIDPLQIILAVFYTFAGFLIIANTMLAVGAAAPNYKDAQSMSSTFIILSIFPVYFFTLILSEPNGTIAQVISYIPFASSLVLIMRNALGALPFWEIGLSIVVLLVYIGISFFAAFKLLEIGALELNKKISIRHLFGIK
jgi:ABC-2 type transport system permease protein